jgi:hypothetical protein
MSTKHHHHDQNHDQNQKAPAPVTTATARALTQNEVNFTPAPDEVARRAYFAYENQGSMPGHDVQHWLAAEAELIKERNQTRVHGFHNKT